MLMDDSLFQNKYFSFHFPSNKRKFRLKLYPSKFFFFRTKTQQTVYIYKRKNLFNKIEALLIQNNGIKRPNLLFVFLFK